MEGKIQVNSGDVSIVAVKVDNVDQTTIPGKNDGKRFDHAECTNGATGNWDSTNWRFLLSGLEKPKIKCTLYFLTGAEPVGGTEIEDKIQDLVNGGIYADQIYYEQEGEVNNIRFIGPDPDNYVTFNGETWRIIGLMDNVVKKDRTKEKLLKIIRKDSLGDYSWDSSASNVNNGYGVNEWSEAAIQKVLNDNYFNKTSGGTCYGSSGNSTKNCPTWTTVGLNPTAQSMVEEVVWKTGTAATTSWTTLITPGYMYSAERSTANEKQCTNGNYCNDTVVRKTEWTGKVGLMYPSDYGLATSGGQLKKRKQCLEISMYNWNESANNYCYQNDWLYDSSSYQWTMTSAPNSSNAHYVFRVDTSGRIYNYGAYRATAVRPVVFLKSSVKITGGTGEESNPYQLKLG